LKSHPDCLGPLASAEGVDQTDILAAIVASWDERLTCEMTTTARVRCRRPATWWADAHGCDAHLMCTGHLRNWERRALAVLRIDGRTRCGLCGRWFTSLDEARRAVRL
jgi:hypothetical protein